MQIESTFMAHRVDVGKKSFSYLFIVSMQVETIIDSLVAGKNPGQENQHDHGATSFPFSSQYWPVR